MWLYVCMYSIYTYVCIDVCMYVHMCVCMYESSCIHKGDADEMCVFMYTFVCTYLCMCVCVYCMNACMYVLHTYVCMYASMYVCMYACSMYVCMHVCITYVFKHVCIQHHHFRIQHIRFGENSGHLFFPLTRTPFAILRTREAAATKREVQTSAINDDHPHVEGHDKLG